MAISTSETNRIGSLLDETVDALTQLIGQLRGEPVDPTAYDSHDEFESKRAEARRIARATLAIALRGAPCVPERREFALDAVQDDLDHP